MSSPSALGEAAVLARLAQRYAAPQYAFLTHVRNATGWSRTTRTADAMAMSLWPSRGLELHGFEVKSARGDWTRELKDPAKADEIASRCDRWWIAAGSAKVVEPSELPSGWGLLVPHGDGMRVVREALVRPEPEPVDRRFLAAILRNATEAMVPKSAVTELAAAEVARTNANWEAARELDRNLAAGEYQPMLDAVRAFEAAAGVSLNRYSGPHLAEAYKLVRGGGVDAIASRLERLRREADAIVDAIRAAQAMTTTATPPTVFDPTT